MPEELHRDTDKTTNSSKKHLTQNRDSTTIQENMENTSDLKLKITSNYNSLSTLSIAISLILIISMIGWINYIMMLGSDESSIIMHMKDMETPFNIIKSNIVNDATLNGFYVFIFMFIILFSYIFGFYYKILFNGTRDKDAAIVIAVCISAILGVSSIFTSPIISSRVVNIVKIFENTVGYGVISATSSNKLATIMDLLYTNDMYPKLNSFPLITINNNFILTIFDIYNFRNMFESIGYKGQSTYNFHTCSDIEIRAKLNPGNEENVQQSFSNLIKGGMIMDLDMYRADLNKRVELYDNDITKLLNIDTSKEGLRPIHLTNILMGEMAKLVVLKNMIGHLCWTYLASLVTVLVSIKYLAINK